MKPTDIKIGKTYRNKNAGRTVRTVLDIGEHIIPPWPGKEQVFVNYLQMFCGHEKRYTLSLASFARWAGSEVP